MSDQEIRALEREAQADPNNAEVQIKLFTARRRSGVPVSSHFRLRNTDNGKYYQYYDAYGKRIVETTEDEVGTNLLPIGGYNGVFATRDAAIKEIQRLIKGKQDLSIYRLVEFQTMSIELVGPPLDQMVDQISAELLQAKKEAQLRKLQKLEEEEQAMIAAKKKKRELELEKLKKIEEEIKDDAAGIKKDVAEPGKPIKKAGKKKAGKKPARKFGSDYDHRWVEEDAGNYDAGGY